ncbi:hypothetical protein J5N97_029797 [Dioscorea zingiberensis]|uniref:Uncharacterized protein n=1 Tax=Dioscorea zingiberensis TaxID=325984 RepID=A0A9D5H3L4_9LILI|nr:hypothetical protein J5N97_029797 [Dioscorea zingiberensis]
MPLLRRDAHVGRLSDSSHRTPTVVPLSLYAFSSPEALSLLDFLFVSDVVILPFLPLVSDVAVLPLISFLTCSPALIMPYLAMRFCHGGSRVILPRRASIQRCPSLAAAHPSPLFNFKPHVEGVPMEHLVKLIPEHELQMARVPAPTQHSSNLGEYYD